MNETTTEMARLRVEECMSYREIGARYGISGQAVQIRLKRVGVGQGAQTGQRRRAARLARLQEAHARIMSGASTPKAEAVVLGYASESSMRSSMRRAGMPINRNLTPAELPHGTTGRYRKGCTCDECRRAHRDRQGKLKGRKPPRHGDSGYRNYGCRCRRCIAGYRKAARARRVAKRKERRT